MHRCGLLAMWAWYVSLQGCLSTAVPEIPYIAGSMLDTKQIHKLTEACDSTGAWRRNGKAEFASNKEGKAKNLHRIFRVRDLNPGLSGESRVS